MEKARRNLDTEESRRFWAEVKKTADWASTLPKWMTAGVILEREENAMREHHCDECRDNKLLRGLSEHSMMEERLNEDHPDWKWTKHQHWEKWKGPDTGIFSYVGTKRGERVEVWEGVHGDYVSEWFVNIDGGMMTNVCIDTWSPKPHLTGVRYSDWEG